MIAEYPDGFYVYETPYETLYLSGEEYDDPRDPDYQIGFYDDEEAFLQDFADCIKLEENDCGYDLSYILETLDSGMPLKEAYRIVERYKEY